MLRLYSLAGCRQGSQHEAGGEQGEHAEARHALLVAQFHEVQLARLDRAPSQQHAQLPGRDLVPRRLLMHEHLDNICSGGRSASYRGGEERQEQRAAERDEREDPVPR
jgi:hypothetical protein